jgi:hypothetical protein
MGRMAEGIKIWHEENDDRGDVSEVAVVPPTSEKQINGALWTLPLSWPRLRKSTISS